jgi:glucose/mannose-6-phosphate isomerase
LLNTSQINEIDKNQMYKIYDKWPEIAEECFNKKYEPIEKEKVEHIVFSGMGGSGTIGDIFEAILSETNIHVSVVK